MDFILDPSEHIKARKLANPDCSTCSGSGIQVTHDDFGIPQAPMFSVQDYCSCTRDKDLMNFHADCKLCLGEGLIRGIDFGAGAGDKEFVWDICDCSAGAQFMPEASVHTPDVTFEF